MDRGLAKIIFIFLEVEHDVLVIILSILEKVKL